MYVVTVRKRAYPTFCEQIVSKRIRCQSVAEAPIPKRVPEVIPWWKRPNSISLKQPQKEASNNNSDMKCKYCPSDEVRCTCNRCEKEVCEHCARTCEKCHAICCNFCTMVNYDSRIDQIFCFDCVDSLKEDEDVVKSVVDCDGDETMSCL